VQVEFTVAADGSVLDAQEIFDAVRAAREVFWTRKSRELSSLL
jgi:hypothetical protein